MIIARIESLILKKGMGDALERAIAYVESGADGIMIHSRDENPDEIFDFCDKFRGYNKTTPLVVVPSSYNTVTEMELIKHGVNVVIYANQLTRKVKRNHRAKESESHLMSIKKIISLIDEL